MMDWIYTAISWILLRWHDVWSFILPGSHYTLGTNWDWILAIVFLVITVRVILFPVFVKQIRSQRAMQALQPKVKELQQKHKGDQQTLREEMMKLYQTEKVNPLMGCLPMFLQIPVFLGLFHVLRRLDPFQVKNTTLYTWTQEQWDSAKVAELFTSPIWARFVSPESELAAQGAHGVTVKVVSGVLVLMMMATTFMTSRQMILKTGWSQDPQQRMIQKLMLYGIPISLLLSGWYFPIGVIIYWVTQNLFSLGQQYWVLHKYPPPALEGATPAKAGGRGPTTAKSLVGRKAAPTKAVPGKAPAKSAPVAKSTAAAKSTPAKSAPAKSASTAKSTPAKAATAKTTTAKGTADTSAPDDSMPARTNAKATGKTPRDKAVTSDNGAAPTPAEAEPAEVAAVVAEEAAEKPAPTRSGPFRRRRDPEPAPVPPAEEPRSLAPKVGAKPVNRKKGPATKSSRKGGSKR
jgi:YidC/Oxa1 family membrane protein insertase